ncbi:MAG: amidohydrolase, partial [Terracidiphilus sp.]
MAAKPSNATSLLVREGRIVAIDGQIGSAAAERVVDAKGRTIMPGFVDAHTHLELTALALYTSLDCRPPAVKSIADIQHRLREAGEKTRPGRWIHAQGTLFQDRQMLEGRYPNRFDLDHASTQHPIAFRSSFHVTILNSKGLEVAGINRDTPDPPGGGIERDAHGEPTGLTKDMHHLLGIPEPSAAEKRAALDRCVREDFLASGVTSLCEISHSREGLMMLRELDIKPRIGVYVHVPAIANFREALSGLPQLFNHNPSYQGIKLFIDGGTTAMAAAFHEPYVLDPSTRGSLAFEADLLAEMVREATDAGIQLAMHAVGDRAQDTVLSSVKNIAPERVSAAR